MNKTFSVTITLHEFSKFSYEIMGHFDSYFEELDVLPKSEIWKAKVLRWLSVILDVPESSIDVCSTAWPTALNKSLQFGISNCELGLLHKALEVLSLLGFNRDYGFRIILKSNEENNYSFASFKVAPQPLSTKYHTSQPFGMFGSSPFWITYDTGSYPYMNVDVAIQH
jgi:hypothetical protein